MAENLLEESEDSPDEALDGNGTPREGSLGKIGRFKRLLGDKKKRIIFGVVLALLLVAMVGGGILFFSGDKEKAEAELPEAEGIQADSELKEEIVFEDIVVLDPFERISLKSGSAKGLISLDIALELINHQDRKQVYALQDKLRRVVEVKVSERTWLELRNPEGKIELKYDLLRQMNSIFPKVTIRNIYFINFLMQ